MQFFRLFPYNQNISALPRDLSYSLRFPNELRIEKQTSTWQTDMLFVPIDFRIYDDDNDGAAPHYFREGFVQIQDAIARFFVKSQSPSPTLPKVLLQRFPTPERTFPIQILIREFMRLFSICMVFLYVFMCVNTVRATVTEKEKQLSEMMKIMGLSTLGIVEPAAMGIVVHSNND